MTRIICFFTSHLWFVAIHPFDDGNGRLTRTITDMLLTKADGMPHRFYSMSAEDGGQSACFKPKFHS